MNQAKSKSGNPETPAALAELYAARAAAAQDSALWLHPMCRPLPTRRRGPFLPLQNGALLTVASEGLLVSHDDGVSWGETIPAAHGQNPLEPASCAVLETAPGAFVMVYLALASKKTKFEWDSDTGEPARGCCCELYSIRTDDGGRTWRDRQCLIDGYNANFFGFIRTAAGRLALVAEHLIANPGRWLVCSFVSDDGGKSWLRSNFIDLGGHGHHDGALEPTVAELSDSRLLMFIRTNLGRFWQAFSDDGGRYWRRLEPSAIDASSSPGQLLRLRSGRLLLVWNRRDPEDGPWPLVNPSKQHSEVPASWHREELSLAISEDDGRTWPRPAVIARLRGGQLSYPHVIERRPGEVWIIPGFASKKWFNEEPLPLGMHIFEEDILRRAAPRNI